MMAEHAARGRFGLFTGGAPVVVAALALAACGGGQPPISFVNSEQPTAAGAPQGLAQSDDPHHVHAKGSHDLPNDIETLEPDHPVAETKQERALVHIHGPNGMVCSGVVLGPRVIATAQQCLKGEPHGVTTLSATHAYRVEVPSSALTWTIRSAKYAIVPSCDWDDLDIGLLVLAEPVPWVEPLKVASAPGAGARVQALGFGRCDGGKIAMRDRIGTVSSRVSDDIVIDVPLCKGDTGGPVVDGAAGEIVGIISHRDDPEGSPLRTTTIARVDTTPARNLFLQATSVADGADASKAKPIACR